MQKTLSNTEAMGDVAHDEVVSLLELGLTLLDFSLTRCRNIRAEVAMLKPPVLEWNTMATTLTAAST